MNEPDGSDPSRHAGDVVEAGRQALVGRWRRTTTSSCAAPYPDVIDFDERGIYFGSKGESRSDFTLWDSGGYQVVDPNRVRISTATDSQVTYAFTVSGNVLSFLTPDGCAIEYRRADR